MINEHDLKDWIHLKAAPLYSVPKKTYVRWFDQYYFFDHLDGMYSYCTNMAGDVLHIAAAAIVVPLRKPVKGQGDEA